MKRENVWALQVKCRFPVPLDRIKASARYILLTHPTPPPPPPPVGELGKHWFGQWLGAKQTTIHYLNQCWLIVNWTLRTDFSDIKILNFSFKNFIRKCRLWNGGHFVQGRWVIHTYAFYTGHSNVNEKWRKRGRSVIWLWRNELPTGHIVLANQPVL